MTNSLLTRSGNGNGGTALWGGRFVFTAGIWGRSGRAVPGAGALRARATGACALRARSTGVCANRARWECASPVAGECATRVTGDRASHVTGPREPRYGGVYEPRYGGVHEPRYVGVREPRYVGVRDACDSGARALCEAGMREPRYGVREAGDVCLCEPRYVGGDACDVGMHALCDVSVRDACDAGVRDACGAAGGAVRRARPVSAERRSGGVLQRAGLSGKFWTGGAGAFAGQRAAGHHWYRKK